MDEANRGIGNREKNEFLLPQSPPSPSQPCFRDKVNVSPILSLVQKQSSQSKLGWLGWIWLEFWHMFSKLFKFSMKQRQISDIHKFLIPSLRKVNKNLEEWYYSTGGQLVLFLNVRNSLCNSGICQKWGVITMFSIPAVHRKYLKCFSIFVLHYLLKGDWFRAPTYWCILFFLVITLISSDEQFKKKTCKYTINKQIHCGPSFLTDITEQTCTFEQPFLGVRPNAYQPHTAEKSTPR